jgi:FkbM family methyltransferase
MIENFIEKIEKLIPGEEVKTILDLGSRDALQAVEFSKRYPWAKIFAFECNPASIKMCMDNSKEFPNIKVVAKAVHEIDGPCRFYPIDTKRTVTTWPDGNPGASSLFLSSGKYDEVEKYVQREIEVEAARLDTWAQNEGITGFDLVWMDLQGGELLALKGMGRLIETVKAIHLEVAQTEIYKNQSLFPEVDDFLKQHGFCLLEKNLCSEHFGDAIYVKDSYLKNRPDMEKQSASRHLTSALVNKNKTKKPKAVIVYLARSLPKDIADLKESLRLLYVNFNQRFNYPIIIFHEDFSDELIAEIRGDAKSSIGFERVEFSIPDFLNENEIPEYFGPYRHNIGYRHMCRFFSGLIYQYPVLKGYDWYWRLDTDSLITDKVNYDLFSYMEKKGYVYGYRVIVPEAQEVVIGLWEAVKKYIQENNIRPEFLRKFLKNGEWNRNMYYTNFEISRFDFWRSDKYTRFFNYLDEAGGIYKQRWGDAPIHTFAVSMFLPERKTHCFHGISYKHQFCCLEGYRGLLDYSIGLGRKIHGITARVGKGLKRLIR